MTAMYDFYYSGPLTARRMKKDSEHRKVNGQLIDPPKLYCTYFEEKWGCVQGIEISWEAASVLAPEHTTNLFDQIASAREKEWDEYAKAKRSTVARSVA